MMHQKDSRQEIILFTRFPEPGKTKTRLIPELGADGAAALQRTMTERIVRDLERLGENNSLAVYFSGGSPERMAEWLGPGIDYYRQTGTGLGEKMLNAFENAWARKAARAVLIGSDCPELDHRLVVEALNALDRSQLVLGPSADGGYYLIGATREIRGDAMRSLFADMPWGSSGVFSLTASRAREAGIPISLLRELHDIDLPQDLAYFHHHSHP